MPYLLSSDSERDPYRPMKKLHVRTGGRALGTFGGRTYAALQAISTALALQSVS